MKSKQSLHLILTLGYIALVTMGFQCDKDVPPLEPTYKFQEEITLFPYKKSYSVGDTIWIQFQTTDKSLWDILGSRRVNTDTTQMRVFINYHKRYPIFNSPGDIFCSAIVEGVADFGFETPQGYNVVGFSTLCSESRYFFKIGFALKSTGIYSIELPTESWLSICPTKTVAPLATFGFRFNLADCNKDVYLSIPPQSRGGELTTVEKAIDQKQMFVFKVD